jgi:hypothetical protein
MKNQTLLLTLGLAATLAVASTAQAKSDQANASAQIDALLAKLWKERGVKPNPIVDDATYIRRIHLDIAGRIPTQAETQAFLSDKATDKRAKLVDKLLASEGYVNHYFNFWADILRVNSNQGGGGGGYAATYSDYVKESLRKNTPYDQIVRDLVSAENPVASSAYYYRDRGMPLDNMANTVRIFLGTRLECAQCHNHPFDKWTQMDFFHMAAFSYGVGFQNGYRGPMDEAQRALQNNKDMSREEMSNLRRAFQEMSRPLRNNNQSVSFDGKRNPELPHDYKYDDAKPKDKIGPRTMFGENLESVSDGARLVDYAKWMTSPENPRFTTVIANRLWKQAMGLGLIEPVDEFMDSTTATSPELMDFLSKEMIARKYDMKSFLRMIYNTQAYQRGAVAVDLQDPKEFAFTGPMLRRMSAEQIWDSLVTLINEYPDTSDWKRALDGKVRAASNEVYTAAIAAKSTDELIADARRIAEKQKDIQKELERLQKEQNAARERKDAEKTRELSRQTNQLQSQLREMVYNTIYKPAIEKAKIEVAALKLPGNLGEIEMEVGMFDDSGRPTEKLRQQIEEAEKRLINQQIDKLKVTDERERRTLRDFFRNANNNWLRAANLQSPAPAGHFLQQFGQSDRETIQNAEAQASVPQALTMLNGNIFDTVTNQSSVLGRNLKTAGNPEAKIDTLFLSLLNRQPDADEKKTILADLEVRGEELYKDVAFALINSQEFLFVK